jgi:hypothetical protein
VGSVPEIVWLDLILIGCHTSEAQMLCAPLTQTAAPTLPCTV